MTRGEQLVLDDANDFVRQATEQLEEQDTSTGIRPFPVIEASETTLETTRFGLGFSPQPLAEVTPGSQGGEGTPTGACCVGTDCSITTETECDTAGGSYQGNGTTCSPNPCVGCCIAPFYADPFYGGDGQYYPIQVDPGFCFSNDCGYGPPCSPCVPCWFGTPVDPDTRYSTVKTEFVGCTNPNPIFGDCISTGIITSINSYDSDCMFTTDCEGSISYSGGLCDGHPDEDCESGNPEFFTETITTLSNPC